MVPAGGLCGLSRPDVGWPHGKLTGAARRWAQAALGRADRTRPETITAEQRAEFAALGVPADQIPTQAPTDEDDYDVWPENHQTVRLFLACETQWRAVAGMGGMIWIGLDYGAVDVVARSMGMSVNYPDLQLMEGEALRLLNGGMS